MEIIKTRPERNYSIDLLRIISMIMVIMLHTLSRSGLLQTTPLSTRFELSWLLEIASYCAVDCFVIISGFVGLNSKFRISRIVQLWVQVVFYLVVAELILQFCTIKSVSEFNYISLLEQFFPVSNNHYWFFTQYFALSFIAPFINLALKNWHSKHCVALSVVLLTLFSIIPTIICSPLPIVNVASNADVFLTHKGYTVIWFIALYIFGCTIKKLKEENKLEIKPWISLFVYVFCVAVVWGVKYICDSKEPRIPTNFIVNYTGIFVVASAISLVLLFNSLRLGKVSSSIVKFITPCVFAAYITNSNPQLYPYYVEGVKPLLKMPAQETVIIFFAIVIGFFIFAVLVDKIRIFIFKISFIDKLIRKLDNTAVNKYFN